MDRRSSCFRSRPHGVSCHRLSTKRMCRTQQREVRWALTHARSPTRRTSRLLQSPQPVARVLSWHPRLPRTLQPRLATRQRPLPRARPDYRRLPPTAPRYEASIDEASAQLKRAVASNDEAHEQQRSAARTAAAALQQASHAGIHNQSWFHHVTHSVGHWASTHWTATLREVSKVGTIVSALAGAAALILAVAGVAFPPLGSSGGSPGNGVARQRGRGRNGRHRVGCNRQRIMDIGRRRRNQLRARRPRQASNQSRPVNPRIPADQTQHSRPRQQSPRSCKLRALTTLGHPPDATGELRLINCKPRRGSDWGFSNDPPRQTFLGSRSVFAIAHRPGR